MAEATLHDAVRRLGPGGKLVVTTPDYGSAWPLVERAVDRSGTSSTTSSTSTSSGPRGCGRLIGDLGLVDIEVRKFLSLPRSRPSSGGGSPACVSRAEAGGVESRFGLIMLGTAVKPE